MLNSIAASSCSFGVFMVSVIFNFINAFRSAFVIGGIVLLIILAFPAGAHAAEVGFFSPDIIEVCRPYGTISLEECSSIVEGIRLQRIIGVVLFVLIFVIAIPALLWSDYKAKKAARSEWQKELDTYMEKLNSK